MRRVVGPIPISRLADLGANAPLTWVLGALILFVMAHVLRRMLHMDSAHKGAGSVMPIWSAVREGICEPVCEDIKTGMDILYVSLNEAFEERDSHHPENAWRLILLTVSKWGQLAEGVSILLGIIAKYMPTVCSTLPGRATTTHRFKSPIMRDYVRMHSLLRQLTFRSKSRFLIRVRMLRGGVETLTEDFRRTSRSSGSSEERLAELWRRFDLELHDFDLLTKETMLTLRAFLACLPDQELSAFEADLCVALPGARSAPNSDNLNHRAGLGYR